jgi:CRISPR system Cascade subunit CasA
MYSFNLIDEKWIPCILPDGNRVELSIQEVFKTAPDIMEIFDPSPLVTVALHRLLLAILHRNFGPSDKYAWQQIWDNRIWDTNQIMAYLSKWHDRFDLFDKKHPFYQCASLPSNNLDSHGKMTSLEKPLANMIHELAAGDNATLFDHTFEASPDIFTPAEAARSLITYQAFSVGGLITRLPGEGPSSDNAPLVKGAVILIKGKNLFQTLMLNFHVYNPDDAEPMEMIDDAPAWENNNDVRPETRRPKGYLDLLTWQSRRVKLIPEPKNEELYVRYVIIMNGYQFPSDFSLYNKETMLAYKAIGKPAIHQSPWMPIVFQEDRALWRDSLSLFQSIQNINQRPKIITWLNDLVTHEIIPIYSTYNMTISGLVTSKAKILLWRHERIPIPLKYLRDEPLVNKLGQSLEITEETARTLENSIWNIAKEIIAPNTEKLNDNQKKNIKNLTNNMAVSRPYWANLGQSFNNLVLKLAEDNTDEKSATLKWWASIIFKEAMDAFSTISDNLNRNGKWLKAIAIAQNDFEIKLNHILKPYKNNK